MCLTNLTKIDKKEITGYKVVFNIKDYYYSYFVMLPIRKGVWNHGKNVPEHAVTGKVLQDVHLSSSHDYEEEASSFSAFRTMEEAFSYKEAILADYSKHPIWHVHEYVKVVKVKLAGELEEGRIPTYYSGGGRSAIQGKKLKLLLEN